MQDTIKYIHVECISRRAAMPTHAILDHPLLSAYVNGVNDNIKYG